MGFTALRTTGSQYSINDGSSPNVFGPSIKKAVVLTSESTRLTLHLDANISSLFGPVNGAYPGGDGSNTLKLYLYEEKMSGVSGARTYPVVNTLKATLVTDSNAFTTGNRPLREHYGASMALEDGTDNLHITYYGWSNKLYYVKATRGGSAGARTYSFGTPVLVYDGSQAGNMYPLRADIDCTYGSGAVPAIAMIGTNFTSPGSILKGQQKAALEPLNSPNGDFRMVVQTDGNLVLARNSNNQVLWSSGTGGGATSNQYKMAMQNDGNFVVYNPDGSARWSLLNVGVTAAQYSQATFAVMQDDGNFVVYTPAAGAVWSTGTYQVGYTPVVRPAAQHRVMVWGINSGNTVVNIYNAQIGTTQQYAVEDVSVVWDHNSGASNPLTNCALAVVYNRYMSNGTDYGDLLQTFRINTTTMAKTKTGASVQVPSPAGTNGRRRYTLFSEFGANLTTDGRMVLAGMAANDSVNLVTAMFQIDANGNVAFLQNFAINKVPSAVPVTSYVTSWSTVSSMNGGIYFRFYFIQRRTETIPYVSPSASTLINQVARGVSLVDAYVTGSLSRARSVTYTTPAFIDAAFDAGFTPGVPGNPFTTQYPLAVRPFTNNGMLQAPYGALASEQAPAGADVIGVAGGNHSSSFTSDPIVIGQNQTVANANRIQEATPVVWFGAGNWQTGYIDIAPPLTPVLQVQNGSTITTSYPSFRGLLRDKSPRPPVPQQLIAVVSQGANNYYSPPGPAGSISSTTVMTGSLVMPIEADNNPFLGRGPKAVQAETGRVNQRFPQGTYSVALVSNNEGGLSTSASNATIIISHPPVATAVTPVDGKAIIAGSEIFQYNFSDPDPFDYETARRIDIEDPVSGATLLSTGKTAVTYTSVPNATGTGFDQVMDQGRSVALAIPAQFQDRQLRWKATVWDYDDVASPSSNYGYFISSIPPVPVITSPADGSTIQTGIPVVTWTPGFSSTTKTQAWFNLVITSLGKTIYDSGKIFTDATSFRVPVGYLHNSTSYTFTLTIGDSVGQQGVATIGLSTAYVMPNNPAAVYTHAYEFSRRGFVFVGWSNALQDASFQYWSLYRRLVTETSWTRLGNFGTTGDVNGYRDYSAVTSKSYQYAITQTVNRFGDIIESDITTSSTVQVLADDSYWLIDTLGLADAVKLYAVQTDSFTENEYEETTFTVVGRGRHTDVGQRIGDSGSLKQHMVPRMKYRGGANTNYVQNPSQRCTKSAVLPDGYVISMSATTAAYVSGLSQYMSPAPHGKEQVFRVTGSNVALNGYVQVEIPLEGDVRTPGMTHFASVWLATFFDKPNAWATANLRGFLRYYDANGVTLGNTSAVAMPLIEYYTPNVGQTNPDTGNQVGMFERRGVNFAIPAAALGAAQARLCLRLIVTDVNSQPDVIFGGAQVEIGTPGEYIDGDLPGVYWQGVPLASRSMTNGYVLAGEQRASIQAMRDLGRDLNLRSPFGKITRVHLGPLSVDRLSGVGVTEQTDVTYTYSEVSR